jgi:dinuclear metal center YbgI/SA1388 family protein
MKLSSIIPILEQIAPPEYAMQNDRIGLQIGDPEQEVKRVIVSLDVTRAVVSAASRQSVDLIVVHHPLIYDPLPNVRLDLYPQSLVYELVKAGISLYVLHTNYDVTEGGTDDVLAARLGIVDPVVLQPNYTGKLFKIVTFVPGEAVDAVRDAISDAGGGVIGNYTHCSFQSPGTGAFIPMPGAQPYVGTVGEPETAPELRLEMQVQENSLHDAITAMIAAHPYEEVAYDVYPLWNKGKVRGFGRYGRLRKPMTFDGFCEMVGDMLEVDDTRIVGDPDARVESIAVMGGSGGSAIGLAHSKGVDAFVTGDVKHSQFMQAKALPINLIDATHLHTERPGMIALSPRLHDLLSPNGVTVEYVDDLTLQSR